MSDLLSRISTGTIDRPVSMIIHGPAGCGKSTFAASFPEPLFIDADRRTSHLDVKRIIPESWDDILGVFRHVAKGEIPCRTLVIDTLDHAELLLHAQLCSTHGVATIEEVGGGYGKGYVTALGEWRRLAVGMDAIRSRGVGLLMLAHSADKLHKNVSGEDYGRTEIKLDKRAAGFLRERVDAVGYASFDTVLVKNKEGKTKAKSTGRATLSFAPNAAVETKRFAAFPASCEFTYEAFTKGEK